VCTFEVRMLRDEDRELARAIGGRARALRHRLGATQEQVAEGVNLSPQVYARLEQGRVLPSIRTLMRLAETLEVSPGQILDTEPMPMSDELPLMKVVEGTPRRGRPKGRSSGAAHELSALQRYAAALDPATRRHLVALAKRLAELPRGER
jgi:transcriptional regulator with XRE-family HTH domain